MRGSQFEVRLGKKASEILPLKTNWMWCHICAIPAMWEVGRWRKEDYGPRQTSGKSLRFHVKK
jgi:hypothetical protein